jgi:hypothetical protein
MMLAELGLSAQALGQSQALGPHRHSVTSKAQQKKPPVTSAVATPAVTQPEVQAPPLRPSQMPAVPPRVSYSNGQLTVVAENSTLGDILNAVHNVTGTQIETTGSAAGDRVAAKIGPGSVREVLLAVLQGSRYDYILLGSANNPDQIERVILTPKTGGAANAAVQGGQPVASTPRSSSGGEDSDEEVEVSPVQQAPPAPNGQPPGSPVQNVKTPEQLLEDLRRMEQQRRSQNPPELQDNRPQRPPD